uniref:Uncharacterized protein n=1 Tax=Sphaerodactylus townsendi TaxID=933632 RepID=A0ACB8FRG8_9SAUR
MELVRLLGVLLVLLLPYVSSYRDRIIGGRECCEDEHPWLALLYSLTVPYCAGVLIDLNWVVTAAHCCKNSHKSPGGLVLPPNFPSWQARQTAAGGDDMGLWVDLQTGLVASHKLFPVGLKLSQTSIPNYGVNQVVNRGCALRDSLEISAGFSTSSDIVVRLGEHDLEVSSGHEQMRISKNTFLFNPKGDCESECKEDIMLIQLNEPAVRTDWVAPVNWATICPDVETICTVMGWGAITSPDETFPTVPHCVNITIFETKLCQDEFPCIVPENILCAGDLEGGRDSCRGDSGGPLICDNTLHGIVSLGGNPCGQPNMPAVYTKICKYADWIQQHLSQSRS